MIKASPFQSVYIKTETQTKFLLKSLKDQDLIKLFQITKLWKEYETGEVKIWNSLIWLKYLITHILQEVDYVQFTLCTSGSTFSSVESDGGMVKVDYFSKTDTGPLPCLTGDESAIWQIRYLPLLWEKPSVSIMTKPDLLPSSGWSCLFLLKGILTFCSSSILA